MAGWVVKLGSHVHANRGTVGQKEIYRPVVVAHSAIGPGAQCMDYNPDLINSPFVVQEGRHSCKIFCRLSD